MYIAILLQRGEKLEDLVRTTDDLVNSSLSFEKQAQNVRRKMYCKNKCLCYSLIGAALVICIIIICVVVWPKSKWIYLGFEGSKTPLWTRRQNIYTKSKVNCLMKQTNLYVASSACRLFCKRNFVHDEPDGKLISSVEIECLSVVRHLTK